MTDMTMNDFQVRALRTWKTEESQRFRQLHALVGVIGEVGETSEMIKKAFFHDHPLDPAMLQREMGDALFYLAVLAWEFGFSLSEVAEGNVTKLLVRYPDGYSDQASRERRDEHGE
jgi:NTP pyrophosphatase (non-canonical NTP hydrolase)